VGNAARPNVMRKAIMLLVLLLVPGCAKGTACPMYRPSSNVTVDGAAFVAAHPHARSLCVAGNGCVSVGPETRHPAVIFLPVQRPGVLRVRVSVTSQAGMVLLNAVARVPVRHYVINAACGITANLGSVTITRDGILRSSRYR
jgi:hypothetical protein